MMIEILRMFDIIGGNGQIRYVSKSTPKTNSLGRIEGSVRSLLESSGVTSISSMISQIFKVTAAIDSGKITQEEGYEILRGAGIGEKELTELINMIESFK